MNNKPGYLRGNTSGDDVLDKPIKAKTLKKKLEKSLQNNKPSIELIEKLGIVNQTDEEYDWELFCKVNEIIEKLNQLAVRVNLIDEEDYE